MGSTPYPGTIQDLTFNLFSILANQHLSANALFLDNSLDNSRGPRIVDRVPRFKLRGSRLLDAGLGLLGVVARSGSKNEVVAVPRLHELSS